MFDKSTAAASHDCFKLNGVEVGFSEKTDVSVQCGRVRIRIQSQPLRFTHELHNGLLVDSWKPIPDRYFKDGLRIYIDDDLALTGGLYGQVFRFPYHDDTGYLRHMRIHDANFFGTLSIDAGLITIDGVAAYVEALADANAVMPVAIKKQFAALALLPPRQKLSLAQALKLPSDQVFHLAIEHPHRLKQFDDAILDFKNLESLWLSFDFPANKGEHKRRLFPEGLFELCKLHTLSLQWAGFEIGALSERIAQLGQLESLRLCSNAITQLPESLGTLRNLALLDVSANKLHSIPACVGELPKLCRLDLSYNPLRTLPKSLRRIADVELSYPSKALYLNTCIAKSSAPAIDDAALRLTPAHPNFEAVAQIINACSTDCLLTRSTLTLCTQAIYAAPMPSKTAPPIGCSKTGGAPDLPTNMPHPSDENGLLATFYAQLNLQELAPLQTWLPRRGMLYFFTAEVYDGTAAIVKYVDCKLSNLRRFEYLPDTRWINSDIDAFDPTTDQPNIVAATQLQFQSGVSLPNFYGANTARFPSLARVFDDDSSQARQRLRSFSSALEETAPAKLKLASLLPKETTHSLNAHVFTQNESPEMQAAHAVGGWAADWINLLSLNSIGDYCFGDVGTLSFSIHKHHLADADFSKVVCTIES